MLTKKVKIRILSLILIITFSIFFIFIIIKNLNKNLLYFKTPTDIFQSKEISFNQKFRLGGMVKKNSLQSTKDEIKFVITDFENEIIISYSGTVPNLFLEGKGVIAEGKLKDKKYFIADSILAKHDENYMPPELKNALSK